MDPREFADFVSDERRDMSACRRCGSTDPVRLGREGCSDCYDGWPRCQTCGCWTDCWPFTPENPHTHEGVQ